MTTDENEIGVSGEQIVPGIYLILIADILMKEHMKYCGVKVAAVTLTVFRSGASSLVRPVSGNRKTLLIRNLNRFQSRVITM
jgi:hypothetical protein